MNIYVKNDNTLRLFWQQLESFIQLFPLLQLCLSVLREFVLLLQLLLELSCELFVLLSQREVALRFQREAVPPFQRDILPMALTACLRSVFEW